MKKYFLLLLLVISAVPALKATHVVGGNFIIDQTGPNTYNITVRVYRDCCQGCSPMPTSLTVGIYDKMTNANQQTFVINTPVLSIISLGDECYTPTGICVQEGIFTAVGINIPNNPNGYYIETGLFARNIILANVLNPNNTGMAFYAEIPDPALAGMNDSPDFGPYPSDGYFCVNNTKLLDFGLIDPDGDSLVYSLVDPLYAPGNGTIPGPYSPINWQPPYSLADIIGGTPVMNINSATGIIAATPSALGCYVFAVRIEEYRNGVKIGEVRRDVQYHALNCVFDDLPAIYLPDTIHIEVFQSGCVDIVVEDPDVTDTISIAVTSDIGPHGGYQTWPAVYQTTPDTSYIFHYTDALGNPDSSIIAKPFASGGAYFGIGSIGLRYCFPADCEDIREQAYYINVEAFSLGCSGDTNSFSKQISLLVIPPQGDHEIVPNVFSPNGDGLNDVFRLGGVANPCADALTVEIYNRWGQKMFASSAIDFKWDGKDTNGKDVPEGTYYVILNGVFGDKDVTSHYALQLFREK